MIGILKIENKANKKIYLLRSSNIRNSIYRLRSKLKKGQLTSFSIQNDWNKYKEKYFTFETVEECKKEDLDTKYNYYKNLFSDRLYNSTSRIHHQWNLYPLSKNSTPKTELILDADGDLLPLKYCIQCELHKLEDSFISNSFYCRSCRQLNDDQETEVENILCNIII